MRFMSAMDSVVNTFFAVCVCIWLNCAKEGIAIRIKAKRRRVIFGFTYLYSVSMDLGAGENIVSAARVRSVRTDGLADRVPPRMHSGSRQIRIINTGKHILWFRVAGRSAGNR